MSFTLNETRWAKDAVENKCLGKSPYETLRRVARYYIDEGYQRDEVRTKIERYILECDSTASIVKWAKTIESAVQFALKHEAVNIEYIPVTESELNKINSLSTGRQSQRLAFALLCLSKYWNICCGGSSYWVNSKDSEIMQMANIKTSVRRQCKLYHDLMEAGIISFSYKVDCNHVRVNFANEDSPIILRIDDFRSLGNQYLMYAGENYFRCAECGIVEKYANPSTGRKQKYCATCAATVKARQKLDSSQRKREST